MKVKVIFRNGEYTAVNLENLNYFRVTETEAKILSLYDKGVEPEDIASELEIAEEECRNTIQTFCTLPENTHLVYETPGKLNEILLMVALDCTMKCSYCYGDGGTYNRERSLMSTETAFKALKAAKSLGDIRIVTFFGGEPLLNFSLIKEVVEQTPQIQYGIITNGTIMTDEIVSFIKEHNIRITVSIDGPEEVHNAGRTYPDGKGTHKKVMETVKMLKEEPIPFAVEATFSKKVLKLGYSATDVLNYLYQITPSINIAPVKVVDDPEYQLSPEEFVNFRIQCIDFAFDKILKGEPINLFDITTFIYRMASPERIISVMFCPYHAQRVAVFPDGDVYPCYLIAKKEYKYGNVFDADFVETFHKTSKKILPRLCRDRLATSYWVVPLLPNICVSDLTEEQDHFFLHEDTAKSSSTVYEHLLNRMSQVKNWDEFFKRLWSG